jgi:hypothetical protein
LHVQDCFGRGPPGHFRRNINHPFKILVVYGLVLSSLHENADFGERNHFPIRGLYRNLGKSRSPRPLFPGVGEPDGQALAFTGRVDRGRTAHRGHPEGLHHGIRRNSVKGRLFFVNDKVQPVLGKFHGAVNVHHKRLPVHHRFNPGRSLDEILVGFSRHAVDLRHHGGNNRRPRRHLHDLYAAAVPRPIASRSFRILRRIS